MKDMDRAAWLKDKRLTTEVRYDTLHAQNYDNEPWGRIYPTHERLLKRFLALLPVNSKVLDAPCGTGKYWPIILESGRALIGVELSTEMLRIAGKKFPSVPIRKSSLQEIEFSDEFDGIICMDSMEFIPPEDWPLVLSNFYRALKSRGCLYFTVEITSEEEIQWSYKAGKERGLPVVMGESGHEEGYHYFPPIYMVIAWVEESGFTVLHSEIGNCYNHFIVCKEI